MDTERGREGANPPPAPAPPRPQGSVLLRHRRLIAGLVMICVGLAWTGMAMVTRGLGPCLLGAFFVSAGLFAATRPSPAARP